MERSRLQDDLLLELRAERDMINEQLELLDPLGVALRKPVAARLLHKGILIVLECLCWLGLCGVLLFCAFRNTIYPFYLLDRIRLKGPAIGLSVTDIQYLYWSVTFFAVVTGLLLFVLARNLSRLRRKNAIIQLAAKHVKTVVGQHLHRKATIDNIEQRHFGISMPNEKDDLIITAFGPADEKK